MEENLLKEYQGVIAKNPFAAGLGIEILDIRKGYAYAKIRKERELENIYGDLHGGCLYAFADNMAGVAASTCGYYVTTVNGSIQYLRAARDTECVFCEATVIKQGRTITVVHADIKDDRETLLNTAEFAYFNLRKRQGD